MRFRCPVSGRIKPGVGSELHAPMTTKLSNRLNPSIFKHDVEEIACHQSCLRFERCRSARDINASISPMKTMHGAFCLASTKMARIAPVTPPRKPSRHACTAHRIAINEHPASRASARANAVSRIPGAITAPQGAQGKVAARVGLEVGDKIERRHVKLRAPPRRPASKRNFTIIKAWNIGPGRPALALNAAESLDSFSDR